ncbi:hypothetical protein [Streptomyces sp. NBC_00690]|uniref:hypothetical protein n=1 Tax=Streptomyces sp. NBC_00690 TaxID=2975808 RepID=UPI002E2D806C|nr:hypothetical protein [Streptomyces sp. NBC_00690]
MPRSSTAPGTAPIIYTRNNGANQRWCFEVGHQGTKYTFLRILNVHSGPVPVVQPDRTITQQPHVALRGPDGRRQQAGRLQVWAMDFRGFAGSTFDRFLW